MKKRKQCFFEGIPLLLTEENGKLLSVEFCKNFEFFDEDGEILALAESQLAEFFAGKRVHFSIALEIYGTDFQKSVWAQIAEIPFGETRTYGQIAENISRPGACRAVGSACGKNSFPVIIPCHRVVGFSSIGGFSADLEIKKKLLEFEKKRC